MHRRLVLGLVVAAVLLAAAIPITGRWWWNSPLAVAGEGLVINVRQGESLGQLTARLEQLGVLRFPVLLNLAGRISGADQNLRPGEYRLPPGISHEELLTLLQSGDTIRYLVTLPEGIRLADAIALLRNSKGLRSVLDGAADPRLLELVSPAATAEGYFLPETYQYERGDTDLGVLAEAHRLMRLALGEAWQQRATGLPFESPYEVLIMASIIEKETGLASERAAIGGVFTRRLLKGMRLQTDPTVIYGLGADFDGNLLRRHLRDEGNPYNTYRHHGLPPGPIALPGRAALRAAAQPADGDTLYFVARGDGSHHFSETLEEHEAAVRRYQLQRRADYRSSPGVGR